MVLSEQQVMDTAEDGAQKKRKGEPTNKENKEPNVPSGSAILAGIYGTSMDARHINEVGSLIGSLMANVANQALFQHEERLEKLEKSTSDNDIHLAMHDERLRILDTQAAESKVLLEKMEERIKASIKVETKSAYAEVVVPMQRVSNASANDANQSTGGNFRSADSSASFQWKPCNFFGHGIRSNQKRDGKIWAGI